MKINVSKATFSSIVGIGQKVKKASKETGNAYLELNRGVNSVVGIDLTEVAKTIDFNSKELQLYAPNLGIDSLRHSIIKEYFPTHGSNMEHISILPGGMPGLDLIIQTLNYFDLTKLNENSCVFICDPNNPTGMKLEDDYLLKKIHEIADTGAIVIFDSPYRKLFFNDSFFEKVLHPNVIICESFSKWIGLPGARTGFIHSTNKEFNEELNIRLLYEFNGVSSPSQILVNQVLSTEDGQKAISDFQVETRKHIKLNIDYLRQNNLLVDEIYKGKDPLGIFAIVNKSEDFLFQNRIGAVGLDKFVYYEKDTWSSYSRICVSVQHELFKQFMSTVV